MQEDNRKTEIQRYELIQRRNNANSVCVRSRCERQCGVGSLVGLNWHYLFIGSIIGGHATTRMERRRYLQVNSAVINSIHIFWEKFDRKFSAPKKIFEDDCDI